MELDQFLISTGRTLSQMSLYKADHPAVKGAIQNSYEQLTSILKEIGELTFSIADDKLIINGEPQEKVPAIALKPYIQLLNLYKLHSLTFLAGITPQETSVFFNLSSRTEARAIGDDLPGFLSKNNIEHIRINMAKYAKIADDQIIAYSEGLGSGTGMEQGDQQVIVDELLNLPLNELLNRLVKKAFVNPEDARTVYERALSLVQGEIKAAVDKATTEFIKEKEQITSERERTEEVVGSMAEGVVVVDDQGNVLMMNQAAESLYGVKLGECVGKPLWAGMQEEQMVALAKDLTVVKNSPVTKEVELRAQEETQRILRASSAAIQNPDGRVVGMVSVLSDVTKQKELTRMQNEFMANVTHDLRTPIHALQLAVAAIVEGSAGPVSKEQERMLTLANRNVERLSRLIDDLLDFSQIESGNMRIKPTVLDLSPHMKEAVATLESWAKNRQINLSVEVASDLSLVYADSDRIMQVINNLISNAIKFTPEQGSVVLRGKNVRDRGRLMVIVEIEDSGKGISPEDQKRIFDRFMQLANKEKLDVRGTGLGLSICKAIVDLHKGQVFVQSPAPGKSSGSLFSFTLPAVQKSAAKVIQSTLEKTTPQPIDAPVKKERKSFWSKIFSIFKVLLILSMAISVCEARPHWGFVRRVLEGDRIQLKDGSAVRYLGIDAPNKGNTHYQESVSANRRLVEGQEVRLEYGLQERNAEGEWLAYVYADGIFINLELVRGGFALVAPLSNDEEYLPDLLTAERQAHRKKRGLWADTVIDPYPVRVKKKSSSPWKQAAPSNDEPVRTTE